MAQERIVNGVNVDQLFNTIDLIKHSPQVAQFKFRATNRWIDGTHNRARVKDFYGALKEDNSREELVFEIDEPPVLCGRNLGPNPVEYLLIALSGCLTTSLVAHAAARGIAIKGVESRYEGDLDLRGFLGISEEVPVGYQSIRLYFKIDADVSEAQQHRQAGAGLRSARSTLSGRVNQQRTRSLTASFLDLLADQDEDREAPSAQALEARSCRRSLKR